MIETDARHGDFQERFGGAQVEGCNLLFHHPRECRLLLLFLFGAAESYNEREWESAPGTLMSDRGFPWAKWQSWAFCDLEQNRKVKMCHGPMAESVGAMMGYVG